MNQRKIFDYDIVNAKIEEVAEAVRARIRENDWEPYGDIQFRRDGKAIQVIVRYEPVSSW